MSSFFKRCTSTGIAKAQQLSQAKERLIALTINRLQSEQLPRSSAGLNALRDELSAFVETLVIKLSLHRSEKEKSRVEWKPSPRADSPSLIEVKKESIDFKQFSLALLLLQKFILQILEEETPLGSSSRDLVLGEIQRKIFLLARADALSPKSNVDRLEEQLLAATHAANIARATKDAFLSNMSHEIRTPLSAIIGYSDLLRSNTGSKAERDNYLLTINRNGRSLMNIIDDILELSDVEAGGVSAHRLLMSLSRLMFEVMEIFVEKARLKGIDLDCIIETEVPDRIISDPTRLRQILINLIGNAVKFTERGGVRIYVSCTPAVGNEIDLLISVEDSGIGLTTEQQAQLFQPFTQADGSCSRKFGGLGLGLALSKNLAKTLGGDVIVKQCKLGQGSTFNLNVIVGKPTIADDLTTTVDIGQQLEMANPLKGTRILLAEDAFDNQLLIRTILVECGAQVEVAANGCEAVEMAMSNNFDVILMDLQMPKMDGYEATLRLRQAGYERPIIALTAHALLEDRRHTREVGCNCHLTKPLNPKELIQTIYQFHHDPKSSFRIPVLNRSTLVAERHRSLH